VRSLKDKQLYAYKGARKAEDFLQFAENGYKTADVVPVPTPAVAEVRTALSRRIVKVLSLRGA
jgi:hypothetical protein